MTGSVPGCTSQCVNQETACVYFNTCGHLLFKKYKEWESGIDKYTLLYLK